MIENLALVMERQHNQVRLTTTSPTGCAKCDRGEGCGGGVFGKLIQRRLQGLLLDDPDLNLQPGQVVVLGVPSGVFLRATAAIYVVPLLGLLLLAGLASAAGLAETGIVISGLLGFVAGALLGPHLRQRYIDAQLQPSLLRRAQPADMQSCSSALS